MARRLWSLAAAVGAVATLAGPAYASHASPSPRLEVTVNDSGLTGIAPGGRRTTTYTIANTSSRAVTGYNLAGSFTVDSRYPRCDPAWFSFDPAGHEDRAYGPRSSITFAGSVLMADVPVNQDGCQGATVTMRLTVWS